MERRRFDGAQAARRRSPSGSNKEGGANQRLTPSSFCFLQFTEA